MSQANFKDGKLNGKWVIYDANEKKLSEWEFTDGRRHGRSTWWYANGTKMREINYDDGILGELLFLMGQYRHSKAVFEASRDSQALAAAGG